jgi:ubiquinone/menaquinone biosynthesis C-methylase UbiE
MPEETMQQEEQSASADGERYSHGYGAQVEFIAQRTAQTSANFFLPYLRPGMRLLDCGCGPGTITVSLAEILALGEVVGIDIGESQVERARIHAAERKVTNVRFEAASIYELPFPDETFDAAFAHTVLQNLRDPIAALKEMRRVMKSGSVVGIREEDWGTHISYPHISLVEDAYALYMRYWQHNGGNPYLSRRYREILREAEFVKARITASTEVRATLESTRQWGQYAARMILEPNFADRVIELGWADSKMVEEMSKAMITWSEHPDALRAITAYEGVAWKE